MKKCTKCKIEKTEEEFYKQKSHKDGLCSWCKECKKIQSKEYAKENPEKIKETMHNYYIKNTDKVLKRNYEYKKHNKNKIKVKRDERYNNDSDYFKIKSKKYRDENPGYFNTYSTNRRQLDFAYKILCVLRARTMSAIKDQSGTKAFRTIELLGCTGKEAALYLESLFQDGMSWQNHGKFGWHIDHIKPCDSFDLTDPEEQKKCFHYTNLQPLWWNDNITKGNKIL